MSKNSPKQNYQAVKEWLAFMKFKPKKKKPQPEFVHSQFEGLDELFMNRK